MGNGIRKVVERRLALDRLSLGDVFCSILDLWVWVWFWFWFW